MKQLILLGLSVTFMTSAAMAEVNYTKIQCAKDFGNETLEELRETGAVVASLAYKFSQVLAGSVVQTSDILFDAQSNYWNQKLSDQIIYDNEFNSAAGDFIDSLGHPAVYRTFGSNVKNLSKDFGDHATNFVSVAVSVVVPSESPQAAQIKEACQDLFFPLAVVTTGTLKAVQKVILGTVKIGDRAMVALKVRKPVPALAAPAAAAPAETMVLPPHPESVAIFNGKKAASTDVVLAIRQGTGYAVVNDKVLFASDVTRDNYGERILGTHWADQKLDPATVAGLQSSGLSYPVQETEIQRLIAKAKDKNQMISVDEFRSLRSFYLHNTPH